MEKVKIDGLYQKGYDAHRGTSFSPEKRAQSIVSDYETELNEDIANMPEADRQQYITKYTGYLFAWLSAKSRIISPMISGPSNFPVRRMEKLNGYEDNRYNEFRQWRGKALDAIKKRANEARPEAEKQDERWMQIKHGIERSIKTIIEIDNGINKWSTRSAFTTSITGAIKTLAKNGDTQMVTKCLELIKEYNGKCKKPIITEKNTIWDAAETAGAKQEEAQETSNRPSEESEINGVVVVKNYAENRLQLFFPDKPDYPTRLKLKRNAYKWSPTRTCWQRQLTTAAVNSVKEVI